MKTTRAQETEFIQAMNDRFEVRCGMGTLLRWLAACDGDAARAEAALLAADCLRREEGLDPVQTEACITAIAGPRVQPNAEQAAMMHRARNYGNYVCDAIECLTATYLVALGWLAWSEARPRQIEITAAGSAILG